jgi:signal transduction histidine kinase
MVTIFNLGTVEEQDSNFVEAQKLYEQSLELAIEGNFIPNQINIYAGLGQMANFLNAKEQAANYFNQGKLILAEYPNALRESNLFGNEGKYFASIKDYGKAKENGLRALAAAESIKSERHIQYAYEVLLLAAEGMNDWPAAARYARKYIDLKEKLDSGKRKQEVVGLQAAMDVERATVRYEKKLKDQELAISQKWINWLVAALVLVLLLTIALAFNYARVRRTNTQLTAARGELQESNFQLVKTNQLLTMANTKLQQFAFATGHDLKESLRNITSFTQLAAIEMAENVPSAQGHLQEATASSKRMRKMLDDLLHFSNIGGSDTSVANIPVQEVVSSVKQQLKAEIAEAQGDVHITTAAIVKANRSEMEQIFFNLIHNALRYRAADTPARITIKMEKAADGQPVFKVTDNGIGIPEQERENIFKPFHRLHNRSQSGSGLGLSICRDIVHAYNGRIWHEPAPNGGSVFCFTIPKAEPKG